MWVGMLYTQPVRRQACARPIYQVKFWYSGTFVLSCFLLSYVIFLVTVALLFVGKSSLLIAVNVSSVFVRFMLIYGYQLAPYFLMPSDVIFIVYISYYSTR